MGWINEGWINEKTVEELKKRRMINFLYDLFALTIGTIFILCGFYFYVETRIIGLSLMLFITGIALLLLSVMPSNLSIMIYLKEQEKKEQEKK